MTLAQPDSVSIELPDGCKAGWPVLINALRSAKEQTGLSLTFGDLIDQIEAQLPKPKPEEPLGYGAVVVDSLAQVWVRTASGRHQAAWQRGGAMNAHLPPVKYADIDAVKVEHGGVRA